MRTGNRRDNAPAALPAVIPVFPLSAALLLPRAALPLTIFELRYLAMVDHALGGARIIGMVQPDEQSPDGPTGPAIECRAGLGGGGVVAGVGRLMSCCAWCSSCWGR
jgi:Lon protease-like protein